MSGKFGSTKEAEAFNELYDILESNWNADSETYHLIGNVNVGGRELDALLIKPNGTMVVEFKDYGGKLVFKHDDEKIGRERCPVGLDEPFDSDRNWYCDDVVVAGGSAVNPLAQARFNKGAVASQIKSLRPKGKQRERVHVAAVIVFQQKIYFDDSQPEYDHPEKLWLKICDFSSAFRTIESVTHPQSSRLSDADVKNLLKSLGRRNQLRPYHPDRRLEEPSSASPSSSNDLSTRNQALEKKIQKEYQGSSSSDTPEIALNKSGAANSDESGNEATLAHVFMPVTNGVPFAIRDVTQQRQAHPSLLYIDNIGSPGDFVVPDEHEALAGVLSEIYKGVFPEKGKLRIGFTGHQAPDAGNSFQLPVFIAAALRLTKDGEGHRFVKTADANRKKTLKEVLWASGEIERDYEDSKGKVRAVDCLEEKLRLSLPMLSIAANSGIPIQIFIPDENKVDEPKLYKVLREGLNDKAEFTITLVDTIRDIYEPLSLPWPLADTPFRSKTNDYLSSQNHPGSTPPIPRANGEQKSQNARRKRRAAKVLFASVLGTGVIALLLVYTSNMFSTPTETISASAPTLLAPTSVSLSADYSSYSALRERGHCPTQDAPTSHYKAITVTGRQVGPQEFTKKGLCRLRLVADMSHGVTEEKPIVWEIILADTSNGVVRGSTRGRDSNPSLMVSSPYALANESYALIILTGHQNLQDAADTIKRGITSGEDIGLLRERVPVDSVYFSSLSYRLSP